MKDQKKKNWYKMQQINWYLSEVLYIFYGSWPWPVILTSDPDALFTMSGLPGSQFTGLSAVVHFFTPGTGRQTDTYWPTTFIAVLKQRLPANQKVHQN